MLGVGLPGLGDQFATGGSQVAPNFYRGFRGRSVGWGQWQWGGAALGTQPGHESSPGQQAPSPELGCAVLAARDPGRAVLQGIRPHGGWQGLAGGAGPLTLHLGAPPPSTWPSRPGKE